MVRISDIKEHMEVVGADGVHVGTVDKVEPDRIKLTKGDGGDSLGVHHYLSTGLVAGVEKDKVRLSTTGANAIMFPEGPSTGSSHSIEDDDVASSRATSRDFRPNRNWGGMAVGAAAVATAAAGAALLAHKRKQPASEFEFQLQTDESIRLISSSKVEGTPVVGRDGEHLGRIENFMVDKYSGRVAYAVLSFGGTLGVGESLFPLPWSYLDYDPAKDGYVLNLTKEQLAKAPSFTASREPEFDVQYRRGLAQIHDRFGR
jgi:hypothetical protein